MGTGMVFWLQASQFQMCMSVPQMADVWMRISTSLGPIVGIGHVLHPQPGLAPALDQCLHGSPLGSGYLITPSARPTLANAAMAASMSAALCAADIWVRMRAWPLGTTGKKNPVT